MPFLTQLVDHIINLIYGTHHSYKRRSYAIKVFQEYCIISLLYIVWQLHIVFLLYKCRLHKCGITISKRYHLQILPRYCCCWTDKNFMYQYVQHVTVYESHNWMCTYSSSALHDCSQTPPNLHQNKWEMFFCSCSLTAWSIPFFSPSLFSLSSSFFFFFSFYIVVDHNIIIFVSVCFKKLMESSWVIYIRVLYFSIWSTVTRTSLVWCDLPLILFLTFINHNKLN